jgi:hypothetical protein
VAILGYGGFVFCGSIGKVQHTVISSHKVQVTGSGWVGYGS